MNKLEIQVSDEVLLKIAQGSLDADVTLEEYASRVMEDFLGPTPDSATVETTHKYLSQGIPHRNEIGPRVELVEDFNTDGNFALLAGAQGYLINLGSQECEVQFMGGTYFVPTLKLAYIDIEAGRSLYKDAQAIVSGARGAASRPHPARRFGSV